MYSIHIPEKVNFRIIENSFLARIAAKKLSSSQMAMVIGKTIHLHNTSRSEFLADEKWLKHELCHIRQYRKYGTVGFITRYLWESLQHGYFQNRFEDEARKAEEL